VIAKLKCPHGRGNYQDGTRGRKASPEEKNPISVGFYYWKQKRGQNNLSDKAKDR